MVVLFQSLPSSLTESLLSDFRNQFLMSFGVMLPHVKFSSALVSTSDSCKWLISRNPYNSGGSWTLCSLTLTIADSQRTKYSRQDSFFCLFM